MTIPRNFKGGESMNLEQALEKIVELNDIIKDRDEQIQSLSQVIEQKSTELENQVSEITRLKESNMRYFERLTQQTESIETHDNQNQEEQKEEVIDIESSWNDFMTQW